jgi:hypothetical protein
MKGSFYKVSSFLLVTLIVSAGCGRYVVVKNGQPVSQQEYSQAQMTCEAKAVQLYPIKSVKVPNPGYIPPPNSESIQTQCLSNGYQTNCISRSQDNSATSGYGAMQFQSSISGGPYNVIDANLNSRTGYKNTCIQSLGFSEVFVKDKK